MGGAGGGNGMGTVVGEFVLLRLTLHNGGKAGRNLIHIVTEGRNLLFGQTHHLLIYLFATGEPGWDVNVTTFYLSGAASVEIKENINNSRKRMFCCGTSGSIGL